MVCYVLGVIVVDLVVNELLFECFLLFVCDGLFDIDIDIELD